jgi:phospholipid/cholesterol/gamma-HCH transport system permease protein
MDKTSGLKKNNFDTVTKKRLVSIPESLDQKWIENCNLLSAEKNSTLILDFSNTSRIDSAGMCFIRLLHSMYEKSGGKLILKNISQDHLELLNSIPSFGDSREQKEITSLKSSTREKIASIKETVTFSLSVMTEMLYWGTIGALKKRDFRKGVLGEQMYQLGYKAVGIVALLSLLIGLVLALQTAMQLKAYGAGIFLAPLIGLTMVKELGPLLTAIILAGRTGSATTAEIATMAVGEEIDALQTMGINPIQFVVVPKFWAITITMPLLSIIATAAGILGGYFVAISYLDLSSNLYWGELGNYLSVRSISAGFIKSVVFSWLIIWIGSFYGLRVRGGAEAVGRETTASVVTGIFIIIIADAIFSFIL